MKYINIKRYKFSTILKNSNSLIVKSFNTLIVKKFKTLSNNVLKLLKSIDLKKYDFKRIYKYLDIRRYHFIKIIKYLDIRKYYFIKIIKYFDPRTYNITRLSKTRFKSSKFLLLHLPASIIFFGLLYLVIPTFYNYDKSNIENAICKNQSIECSIKGEVIYRFYPTPRIKIKDLIINDFFKKKNTLIKAEQAVINLSIKNLLVKERHKFKKIKLNNFKINFDLKNLKKFKNIFVEKIDLIPITFTKGNILFNDKAIGLR